VTRGPERFDHDERFVPGDAATAAEQVRELRQPYVTPRRARFSFPPASACFKKKITPEQIAHDLCDGDKLNLRPRVLRHMHEHCYIFDPERVWLRAISRAVYHGVTDGVRNPSGAWLDDHVEQTIHDLVMDDRDDEWEKLPLDDHHEFDYAIFLEKLAIPPARCRLASVRFNTMPFERRRAIFRTVIDGWSLERCEAIGLGPIEVVRDELRKGLAYVTHASDDLEPPQPGPASPSMN